MAVYLMCVYGEPKTNQWFREAFQAAGKKLNMGKSCVRFKKLDGLPLDVIGRVIARTPVEKYIGCIEQTLKRAPRKRKK